LKNLLFNCFETRQHVISPTIESFPQYIIKLCARLEKLNDIYLNILIYIKIFL
jgi:hypothetical protein